MGMFKHIPVHIGHPKSSIRSGSNRDGRAHRICGRHELALRFIGGPLTSEGRAFWNQQLAMDEIMDRLADKPTLSELLPKQRVPINHHAGGRGKRVAVVVVTRTRLAAGTDRE